MLGHRQAFAWIDEWINMSYEDVRQYESNLQLQTNNLVKPVELPQSCSDGGGSGDFDSLSSSSISASVTTPPKSPAKKGYFSWF